MSAVAVTMPSVKRKPAASSRSAPGVRIVTANGSPFTRTSSAASTATSSIDVSRAAPSPTRTTAMRCIRSRPGIGRQDNIGRVACPDRVGIDCRSAAPGWPGARSARIGDV